MKSPALDFLRPDTLDQAIAALHAGSVALGGGQSLIPMLNLRVAEAARLVALSRLPALRAVAEHDGLISYGAATTHAAFEDGEVADASLGLMAKVAAGIAYRAVRNFGTIGGAVALADPAADWPVCLIGLDATAVVTGPDGTRRLPVAALMQGPYATGLTAGEIIVAFEVARLAADARWGYVKIARKQGAYAESLACVVWPGGNVAPRVVLGATREGVVQLARTADALARLPDAAPAALRALILSDVAPAEPDRDPHRLRCHVAAVTRAIAQAKPAHVKGAPCI